MFAYNPTVNDNSGQITAGYQTKSAEIKAAGNEALAKGITDGVTSIAGGVIGGFTKAAENRVASDGVNAKFDMLKGLKKPDGGDLFTQETIDKFDTMPLGKRQAIVSTADSIMDHTLKQWMYQTQYNAQNNRVSANMLAQQPAPNQVPMSTNTVPAAQTQANPAPAPAQDWRSLVKPRQ
jgi:hypothetical protein